jgi:hypothetical protein
MKECEMAMKMFVAAIGLLGVGELVQCDGSWRSGLCR